ncbi:MAG TPA: hypothetical protein VMU50_16455 [Polyangia bacterium]|nr:hypothetical protein [Polyangia bacterium]
MALTPSPLCRAQGVAASSPPPESAEQSRTLRAAGAKAFTDGIFDRAADLLEQAHALSPTASDPELHYLRGEALYTLGREADAEGVHQLAERQLGSRPAERLPRLWLARIYARRGEFARADIVYETLWPKPPAVDVEVAINQAESHLLGHDLKGARQVLARLLARDPRNVRGREILAWLMELDGDLAGELSVRSSLASDSPSAANWAAWGRALERAGDLPAARDRYLTAAAAAPGREDQTVTAALARTRYRTTPELGTSIAASRDPQADALRLQAGAALPFGPRHVLSLVGWREMSSGHVLRGNTLVDGGGSATGLRAGAGFASGSGRSLLVAADVRQSTSASSDPAGGSINRWLFGALAESALPFLGHAELRLRGELNQPWNDAPVTLSEGGSVNSGTGDLYIYPSSRLLLFMLGGQYRQLRLARASALEDPTSTQRSVYGGVDLVLWSNPVHLLRAEALDERMLSRSSLTDAVIVSYRHLQMWGDSTPDFASRIVLGPRAVVNLGTATVRKVVAAERAGIELRGAFGYDGARDATLYSAGMAASVALSWSSKLLFNYELNKETALGFTGTRQTAWVSLHADL